MIIKHYKKITLLTSGILCFLILFTMVDVQGGNRDYYFEAANEDDQGLKASGRVTVSPFIIDNNGVEGITWTQIVKNTWCTGSGTIESPYVIANIKIDGEGINHCLLIMNSKVHFVIKTSDFSNALVSGIQLENVINSKIEYNQISNIFENGISLYNCDNNNLSKNTITNNKENGILVVQGENNLFYDNIIRSNYKDGINLAYCSNNNITENSVFSNYENGISILYSDNNLIFDNVAVYNRIDGISIIYSDDNEITENYLNSNSNNGIYLAYSEGNVLKYNELYSNLRSIKQFNCKDNTFEDNVGFVGEQASEGFSNIIFLFIFMIVVLILGLILLSIFMTIREKRRYKAYIKLKRMSFTKEKK